MHRTHTRRRYTLVSLSASGVALLAVTYIGLIAVTMSYAAATVEFSQSVRNSETAVAELESRYLAIISHISTADYAALGYARPLSKLFVQKKSGTALR